MTTKVSNNSSSQKSGFNWSAFSVIFKWTIISVFVIGFGKVIYTLLASAGSIVDSLAKAFGDGVKLFEAGFEGCTKQTSCSKVKPVEANACKAFDDCNWIDDDDVGGCYMKNPDNEEGEGGMLSSKCVLFIGAIIYFCAQLFLILFSGLVKYATKSNSEQTKALDDIGKRTGKDFETSVLDIKENMERNDIIEEKLREEYEKADSEGAKTDAYKKIRDFYKSRYTKAFVEKMENSGSGADGEGTREWIDGIGDVGDAFKTINDGKGGAEIAINTEIINKHAESFANATDANIASVKKAHEATMVQAERRVAEATISDGAKDIARDANNEMKEKGNEAIDKGFPMDAVP